MTRQPIEPYMKANLLTPFGMAASGYAWNDAFEKRMARPHDQKGKPFDNNKPTATDIARYAAAGELRTTPTDYAKFLIEVIDPKKSDAFRLNEKSRQEMLRPQVRVSDSSSWALGWQIQHGEKGDVITHGGDNKGFHAFVAASVERKYGFVILTNGENGTQVINNLVFSETLQRLLVG
jgi:CubicO group peptidase (beta-lactamase class C family)